MSAAIKRSTPSVARRLHITATSAINTALLMTSASQAILRMPTTTWQVAAEKPAASAFNRS